MRLLAAISITFCALAFGGCGREKTVRVSSPEQLADFVGRRIEMVGIVATNGTPQILGVDLWGMEKIAGQRVRVSGILQRTVITMSGDHGRAIDSGQDGFAQPIFRGAGTYYRLQQLSYVSDR